MTGHVFISHGSEDREAAEHLCAFVEARGVKAWMAPRDIRPGLDYSEALQGAIEASAAFVVLVTETSNKSPYVRAETEMAFSNHKPIFPVRFADIKPAAGLALFLKIRHWTDAYGPGRDQSFERLAAELAAVTGAAAPAEAPAPAPAPAPTTPPQPSTPQPSSTMSQDEERIAAAIGPNADYFRRKWAEMDSKGRSYDWNWAACFLNFCWFAYRKMWLVAAAVGLVYIVTTPLFDPTDKQLFRIVTFFVVGISFATGAFGNMLYRKQIQRLVAGTAAMGQEEALQHLRRHGGPSVPALIGSIVAILLLGSAASMALGVQPGLPAAPVANNGGPQTGAEPAAAEPALPATPVLDTGYLIGRWSDEGNCSRAYEFTGDGRFVSADGEAVEWRLDGNEIVMTGPGGTAVMRAQPIDRNTMTITSATGETSNPIRC